MIDRTRAGSRSPGGSTAPPGIEIDPVSTDVITIERGLFGFEEARLGNPNHIHFGIFLRDGGGKVEGGVDCHVMWRRLFVKTLWVREELRGRGHGTILMERVEAAAIPMKCRSIWLTALGQPAYGFYLKLGYRAFGEHQDYVAGQTLYSLRKDIAP